MFPCETRLKCDEEQEHDDILKTAAKYLWTEHHEETFKEIKHFIGGITENIHYDRLEETRLKCDASKERLDKALEQKHDDMWKTVAYASSSSGSSKILDVQ